MNETTTDAASIFAPLWKRKWLILLVAFAVAAATYEYYKHQPATYTAKTSLYLGGSSESVASLGGANSKTSVSGRELTNQVELINSPIISAPVHKHLREEGNLKAARSRSKATASASSSFITITTEGRSPQGAAALANALAQLYIQRQRTNYYRNLRNAIANTREQLRRIETPTAPKGSKGTSSSGGNAANALQAATLASKINQLEAGLSGYTGVQQVGVAKAAPLPLSPKPKENAIFGFVLGLLLACVAAYAFAQFDRKLSSLAEVESLFQSQILTALPRVRSPVVRPNGERAPAKPLLEPLRRLQTTLALGDMITREGGPRSLVFLSADPGDGRSSIVTNLARVQRDAGKRVVVVEADFRRPTLGRMLDVTAPHGLVEVLEGTVGLHEAMRSVETPHAATSTDPAAAQGGVSTLVASRGMGSLSVLLGGEHAENPPALLARGEMAELVRSLSYDYDYVLIDAPPPLEVSDVMPLLTCVDGILLVARVGHTRDRSAERLAQLLARTPSAPVLGVVANCVAPKDIERHGFAVGRPGRRKRIGR